MMNRDQEINILNVEISLIEQKMGIIKSNLETCIKNISDNQRSIGRIKLMVMFNKIINYNC